ncbi:hypothetical protein NQ176_g10945 [Zarea fungicola]|uniref:Uncharacterized protein n=1 Tax=Zarea fungicola TaxID=93591 RepID=A0ACC1MCU7_9HYPO|nr:hypothetical protein NQ176_g10945 [Lecanicillium fungicola]
MKKALKAEQEGGGAAGLENQLVGEDKHAGLGQEVGVDSIGLEDGEDLAVDHVEHGLPGLLVDSLEAEGGGIDGEVVGTGGEPNLEELLGACCRVGDNIVINGQMGRRRRRGKGIVARDGGVLDHCRGWIARAIVAAETLRRLLERVGPQESGDSMALAEPAAMRLREEEERVINVSGGR